MAGIHLSANAVPTTAQLSSSQSTTKSKKKWSGAISVQAGTRTRMPVSEVQGPLGLQLTIPTTHPVMPQDHMRPSGRTRSLPLGESSQGPSYGRRTQSEGALSGVPPLPLSLARLSPSADNVATDQPSAAPSPVPTEIIPPELTQEEIVIDIQRSGIKVRDFAYESSIPLDKHAPELFDPILAWHVYEAILENPNPARNPLNGKHLRRLLDLGWVSEDTDGHRWLEKDREALEMFDGHPNYPWEALNLTKPNKDDLREVATARFQWVNADQLVPQFVNRGIPRLTTALRGPRATPRYQKRTVIDPSEVSQDPDTSPRLKKRRLSIGAELVAAPILPVHVPLALVNGKPPQQFPAGRPSDAPRPAPLPSQGALSRSLQRHLSMASVSSPYSTDLARSDSRTTLTQSSHHES